MKRLAVVLVVLAACAGGISAADLASTRDAAKLSGMEYSRLDADTAGAALARGAYCASVAVLRRNDAGVPDAGIACAP